MKKIKTVYFDLFFTLVNPKYYGDRNENDVLGISQLCWENIAENENLYFRRASGIVREPADIINEILDKLDMKITENQKKEILELRKERFKKALIEVDNNIINTLIKLKKKGLKLCLISNADKIDILYWESSPLSKLFDEVIFSCEIGVLKPNREIYEIALNKTETGVFEGIFIGDGGSDELKGAKDVGLKTILVSHLLKRESEQHERLVKISDYHVDNFSDILNYIW